MNQRVRLVLAGYVNSLDMFITLWILAFALTLLRLAPSKVHKDPKMPEQNNNRRMYRLMQPASLDRIKLNNRLTDLQT